MYVFFTLERFLLFCVGLEEGQKKLLEINQSKRITFSDFSRMKFLHKKDEDHFHLVMCSSQTFPPPY
jgi:hypothetical protein